MAACNGRPGALRRRDRRRSGRHRGGGKDSPFHKSLKDLVEAIKADPSSVAFAGGSAAGGFDHMKPLHGPASAGGFDRHPRQVKYIGVDGGADAITQTVGGFTQGDDRRHVGDRRVPEVGRSTSALAVLTEERVPGFEDIPTAKRAGLRRGRGQLARPLRAEGHFRRTAYNAWAEKPRRRWRTPMSGRKPMVGERPGAVHQGRQMTSRTGSTSVVADTKDLSKEIGVIQ